MSFANKMKSGFTLIELLIVIAIIGIVMSIGVANLITAQKQARDANRRQIIHNVQTAFEQYYASTGSYPDSSNIGSAFDNGSAPTDPKNSGVYTINYSNTSASSYCVCATLEGGGGNASGAIGTSCAWADDGDYYCAQNKQ
ncbi:MAG: hypothetical protein Fur0011_4260 [Candidatus Microgenomates bacterium]